MNSRIEKDLAPGTAAIPKPIAPETDDSAQRNREVLSTRAEPHTAPAQLSETPQRCVSTASALAIGMLAGMLVDNLDQAKRMIQIGNLEMAESHFRQAAKQFEQIKNA